MGEKEKKIGNTGGQKVDGGKRVQTLQTTGARSSEDMSSEDMILWFYPTTEEYRWRELNRFCHRSTKYSETGKGLRVTEEGGF